MSAAGAKPSQKSLLAALTAEGERLLRRASVAVREVEQQMLATLSASARHRLHADLTACVDALTGPDRA